MKNQLQHIKIKNFTTELGAAVLELNLSYQVFGKELGTAPIILINHALTGNSEVAVRTSPQTITKNICT